MTGLKQYRYGSNEFDVAFDNIIRMLQKKIVRYKQDDIDESNTIEGLIYPLFSVLGWDTNEVYEVQKERNTSSKKGQVDIAFKVPAKRLNIRTNKFEEYFKPIIYLEAKRINDTIEDGRATVQALLYGLEDYIDYVLTSNGDTYHLYDTKEPGSLEQGNLKAKLAFTIQISTNKNIEYLKLFRRINVKREQFSIDLKACITESKAIEIWKKDEFISYIKPGIASIWEDYSHLNKLMIDSDKIELLFGNFEIEEILVLLRDQINKNHSIYWFTGRTRNVEDLLSIHDFLNQEDIDSYNKNMIEIMDILSKLEIDFKKEFYFKDYLVKGVKRGYIFSNENQIVFFKYIFLPPNEGEKISIYSNNGIRSIGKYVSPNWSWEYLKVFIDLGLEQILRQSYEAAVEDAGLNEQVIIAQ